MALVKASNAAIREAAALIRAGQLVAFPTETVYGLGADATNGEAVARIFEAKGRPRFNPLIVHVPSLDHAAELAEMPPLARRLGKAFWPGPLTLVLRRKTGSRLSELVTAGLETVAIRVPGHPTALALLESCGRPLAAPSANRSGHVSPTVAEHVESDLGDRVAMILDAGPSERGLESTVLDVTAGHVVMLRSGALTAEEIESVVGAPIARSTEAEARPASPGQLASHYAPAARVRSNATDVRSGEALLAFGPRPLETDGPMINLSRRGDLVEAAAGLFGALRALDATGVAVIAVMPIPETGLGEAINDRLRRAAAPR